MRLRMRHPILFKNIQTIMRRLRVDQTKLGELCGVTQGSVSRWGVQSMPRGDALTLLADQGGVTPKQIIEELLPEDDDYAMRRVRVIGFVGAGAAVYAFEALDGLHSELPTIEVPAEIPGSVALEVKGDSLLPDAEEGWSVLYTGAATFDDRDILGRLCVVTVEDGRMLVKKVQPGSKPGLYNLVSTNAPVMRDQRLIRAAPVTAIIPR